MLEGRQGGTVVGGHEGVSFKSYHAEKEDRPYVMQLEDKQDLET